MLICGSIYYKHSLLVEHKIQEGNYSRTINEIVKKVPSNSCVSYSHNEQYYKSIQIDTTSLLNQHPTLFMCACVNPKSNK